MITEEWHKQEKVYSSRANEAYVTKRNGRVKMRGMCSLLHFLSTDEENTLSLCLAKIHECMFIKRERICSDICNQCVFYEEDREGKRGRLAYISDFINRRPK